MLVKGPVIIMNVYLRDAGAQAFHPCSQRHTGKHIKLTRIETEAKIWERKGIEKEVQILRIAFIHILKGNPRIHLTGLVQKLSPGIYAVFQPEMLT
jgi:hypothetical protein